MGVTDLKKNKEIREAIGTKRLKYFEVAEACGVCITTFSHWLQRELPEEKKQQILATIDKLAMEMYGK